MSLASETAIYRATMCIEQYVTVFSIGYTTRPGVYHDNKLAYLITWPTTHQEELLVAGSLCPPPLFIVGWGQKVWLLRLLSVIQLGSSLFLLVLMKVGEIQRLILNLQATLLSYKKQRSVSSQTVTVWLLINLNWLVINLTLVARLMCLLSI